MGVSQPALPELRHAKEKFTGAVGVGKDGDLCGAIHAVAQVEGVGLN